MEKKQLPVEFKEFIQCLNNNKVKYLLVGGWAVGIHGEPRATKDIDFLISVKKDNLLKLEKALYEFGSPPVNIDGFKEKGYVVRLGSSPTQIDIINKASGIEIDDCYKRKEVVNVENTDVYVISIKDLIKNKKASGRKEDISDAEKLEKHIRHDKKINEIKALSCFKHYEIDNDTIENKIKNIKKLEDYTDYANECRRYKKITKYKYNNGKDYFILQGIKDSGKNKFKAFVWHFKEDFNKMSAMNFILQYNEKSKKYDRLDNSGEKDGGRK